MVIYFPVWWSRSLIVHFSPCSIIKVFIVLLFSSPSILQILIYQFWQYTRPSATCAAVTTKRRQYSCAAPSTPTLPHASSGNVGICSSSRAKTMEWTFMSLFTLRYTWTRTAHKRSARCGVAPCFLPLPSHFNPVLFCHQDKASPSWTYFILSWFWIEYVSHSRFT